MSHLPFSFVKFLGQGVCVCVCVMDLRDGSVDATFSPSA